MCGSETHPIPTFTVSPMENDVCVRSLVRHIWLEAGSVSDGDMDVKT